jgi:hypothetical protein
MEGMEVYLHIVLNSPLDGGGWSASHPERFAPGERVNQFHVQCLPLFVYCCISLQPHLAYYSQPKTPVTSASCHYLVMSVNIVVNSDQQLEGDTVNPRYNRLILGGGGAYNLCLP